jgi:hypothetical protein
MPAPPRVPAEPGISEPGINTDCVSSSEMGPPPVQHPNAARADSGHFDGRHTQARPLLHARTNGRPTGTETGGSR